VAQIKDQAPNAVQRIQDFIEFVRSRLFPHCVDGEIMQTVAQIFVLDNGSGLQAERQFFFGNILEIPA
jgi:hypothetical protein